MIYTNWAAAQPENAHLCAIVDEYAGQGFKWDDKSCTETHYFMCQLGKNPYICLPNKQLRFSNTSHALTHARELA